MATNNFLPFCPTDTGTNLLTQSEYNISTDRTSGNKPGVASAKLVNRAIRQSAFISSNLAQYISNKLNANVIDDANDAALLAQIYAALAPNDLMCMENIGLASSVGASALTIALKTQAGTDASATDIAFVGMRSSTLTTGLFNRRSITGALSLTVASGATLGQSNAIPTNVYIYAIDNAGTIELAVAGEGYQLPASGIATTTALSGASNSNSTLYSTTARSNVPARLLGILNNTQATAGTWASAGNYIKLAGDGAPRTVDSSLVGIVDGSSAPSGAVGETVEYGLSTFTNVPGLSSIWAPIQTVVIPKGHWSVSYSNNVDANGSTMTGFQICLSSSNGDNSTGAEAGKTLQQLVVGNLSSGTLTSPNFKLNLTADTTYFLKQRASYSAGTPQYTFSFLAERVR